MMDPIGGKAVNDCLGQALPAPSRFLGTLRSLLLAEDWSWVDLGLIGSVQIMIASWTQILAHD